MEKLFKVCYVVKTDEEGEELWSQTYGGEEDDICKSIVTTFDSDYVLGGTTQSFGEGEMDF